MYTQLGRSMIEMMGVLAIIGVLSVGGLDMISKARRNNQIAGLLSGVSNLAGTILQNRKYAEEVKSSYGKNYILFLNKIGKLPEGFKYEATSKALTSDLGNKIEAKIDENHVVTITVSGLDKEACMKIATNNWGDRVNNRFAGVIIGNNADFSCLNNAENPCNAGTNSAFSGQDGYPMKIAKATAACSSSNNLNQNIVNLAYKF